MRVIEHDEPPLCTFLIVGVCLAVFAAQLAHSDLAMLYAWDWRVGAGEHWRLITCAFLHGSVIHLLFNLLWIWKFGKAIEYWLGPWLLLAMYAFLALGSGAIQSLYAGPSIGASGAVYGLFGFLWVVRRRYTFASEVVTPQTVSWLVGWLIICGVMNMLGGYIGIGNAAHVGGLALGWLLGQAVVARRVRRLPLGVAAAATGLGAALMCWGPVWRHTAGRLPEAIAAPKPTLRVELPVELLKKIESEAQADRPGFFF